MISGGKEPIPFHVMVAEVVHSLTRYKEFVTILNRHGICEPYNMVKRIDVDITEFHDTILVLFQNVPANKQKPSDKSVISTRPFSAQSKSTVKLRSK